VTRPVGHDPNPLATLPGDDQALEAGRSDNITTATAASRGLEAAMNNPHAVLTGQPVTVAESADGFAQWRGVANPYGRGIRAYEPNTQLLDDYTTAYNNVQQSKQEDAAAAELAKASTITVPGQDGASWSGGFAGGGNITADGKVATMVQAALNLAARRVPYVWGGTGANGVDCSGLIMYAAQAAGIQGVKRWRAVDYGKMGSAVALDQARPGDVIFYDEGGGNGHVGIYLGNGKMVAAPQTGDVVKVQDVYGTPTSVRRIFNDQSFGTVATPTGAASFNYNNSYYNPAGVVTSSNTIRRTGSGSTRAI
jgi:cell wall-associated NlpC family hydrolase